MKHNDDIADEPPPTAQERAEAEELARALEPGAPTGTPGTPAAAAPEDALAAAALLRQARRAQAPEAAARERDRLAAAGARALPVTAARAPRRRRWLWPALVAPAFAVAAAMLLFVQARGPARRVALRGLTLPPAPPVALLQAQARAVRGRADLAALDRQMRDYRAAYYAALAGGDSEAP